MEQDLIKSLSRQRDTIAALQGEVFALKSAFAVLAAHIALLTRAPQAKREEIVCNLGSMLPGALAKMEHDDAPAAATAGFEHSIETLMHLTRTAVRFEPMTSAKANTRTTRDER